MKRGGLFLAAFLLISGILRFSAPGASGTASDGAAPPRKVGAGDGVKSIPRIPYLLKFAEKIQEFYGVEETGSPGASDLASYFKSLQVPAGQPPRVPQQFVIAILPDPVHTHLGLFFDRSAEALQQAAQMKGYVFDRAILPWDRTPRAEPSDLEARQEASDEQKQRESYPGLLIFRPAAQPATRDSAPRPSSSNISDSSPQAVPQGRAISRGPLFVLVVGETPTAGLNKTQFRNAVRIILELRKAGIPSSGKPEQAVRPLENVQEVREDGKAPLLILGPSFSGSLESLNSELKQPDVSRISPQEFVYSGTVTATGSIQWFEQQLAALSGAHFASFQQNDDFARHEFLQFAADRGYELRQIAVLSEDETVYGATHSECLQPASSVSPGSCQDASQQDPLDKDVLKLHFPREISYFRSAYQKESSPQPASASPRAPGVSTLPLDLDENGNDDDAVSPYAVPQTSASQEAVMLGIVSELQKHHIKFTLLLASDPLDQLFLASYLRKAYAEGWVVVTVPDMLFTRQGDPALRGVLGLNAYALIPGLSDRLCRQDESAGQHEDRIFVSSLSVGTFNAMVGLLSVREGEQRGWIPTHKSGKLSVESLPYAPYADYGTPGLFGVPRDFCDERPLLWLTILGRDGFWPVTALSARGLLVPRGQEPIAVFPNRQGPPNTLKTAFGPYSILASSEVPSIKTRTTPAWNIAYGICLLLLVAHALLSWSGSVLADSEARAQFARNTDCRGTLIMAIGAFTLASAFVLVMCTRNPKVDWDIFRGQTVLMWFPFVAFVAMTIWDLGNLRHQRLVAIIFAFFICVMTWFQVFLTWVPSGSMHEYWSTRMLHITSGVSPVLPVLLLMAAAYWWAWMSLRGVCLVDLRRPRLPEKNDLPVESYRISDTEGEELRKTAHPFLFAWQVLIPVMVLVAMSLTVLDRGHPVQTIEGKPYDIGFSLLLTLMIAVFIGCLLKLVWTWLKCRQVLAGLDRIPLRVAFSRMKDLSWHSFWNPGGSTLRETYKVMSRAMETLTRLLAMVENWDTPLSDAARRNARTQIRSTLDARQSVYDAFAGIISDRDKKTDSAKSRRCRPRIALLVRIRTIARIVLRVLNPLHVLLGLRRCWKGRNKALWDDYRKGWRLKILMRSVEALQKEMAKTGAVLIRDVLKPAWQEEEVTSVSSDERMEKKPLLPFRAMAEEYAALVYVNFLVSVLLRIRTLVIAAGGMYVLMVLSMNTYPFEPHPALQTLAVLLLVVMVGSVGYVYAEMHREVILSHLTSTTAGELGWDFWIKLASAAAIPVFSLLAAQFPGINQFLFSWLQPALQAMK